MIKCIDIVPLEIQGVVFPTNLVEFLFREFYLILGMDCLVEHRGNLDCTSKRVTLRSDEDIEIAMVDEHLDYLSNVISAFTAEKLVRKGCEAYLTFMSDSGFVKLSVKDI